MRIYYNLLDNKCQMQERRAVMKEKKDIFQGKVKKEYYSKSY